MTARLLNAAVFAAEKHRRQRRKDAERSPYINHPLAVAACLAVEGGVTDETLLVAAMLHDTIEDTATTPDDCGRLSVPMSADWSGEFQTTRRWRKQYASNCKSSTRRSCRRKRSN